MKTVRYGGNLEIGDFIAITFATGFTFGWYVGEGKNTLQYYEYHQPKRCLDYYNTCKNDDKYYHHLKANEEEFNKTWIGKSYLLTWKYRVMKIENPESIFTNPDNLQTYLESKEILKTLNII